MSDIPQLQITILIQSIPSQQVEGVRPQEILCIMGFPQVHKDVDLHVRTYKEPLVS